VDRIVLQGLEFHGYLSVDLPERDALRETVDYSRVYALVRREVTEKRYQLIEALASRIARAVLEAEPAVVSVLVRVHKPHAPLPGVVRDVFVEVRRERG